MKTISATYARKSSKAGGKASPPSAKEADL